MRSFFPLSTVLSPQSASLNRVTQALTLTFVGVSAWWLGQLAWQIVSPPPNVPKWQPPKIIAENQSTSNFDMAALTQLHLFGKYQPPSKTKPTPTAPAVMPKTRLRVTLVGVVASRDPSLSLAVIGQKQQQATYGIGETLEGTSAKVKDIFADRVILSNQGRDEVVFLDGEPNNGDHARRQPNREASKTS